MDTATPGPLETSIREKLVQLVQPASITISNDSWQHRHHAPMRAQGGGNGETHFSVQIVSDAFKGKTTMQRHRMVFSALSEELSQGLHSLSLKTKTTDEVEGSES
ncbi:putative BolA IbaG family protein [Lyophyllum shimeji]|uniref:BolA IbaG family protein n=1 Tax=Lyophyllum shimeji TaxID=47721 RepID=A0A9P3PLH2_LYOSH|nr:putative BolA IbaG family protein [Lyophyllum shimeji]